MIASLNHCPAQNPESFPLLVKEKPHVGERKHS